MTKKSETDAETPTQHGSTLSRVSTKFTVTGCLFLVLAMCVFWLISSYSNRSLLQQQADGLGQALAEQSAMQLTELILANDLISMNVVLNSLTEATGIQRISVLSVDHAVLAEAEGREEAIRPLVSLPFPLASIRARYEAPITLNDAVAGTVLLELNLDYIEAGAANSLLLIVAATFLLLTVCVLLSGIYFQHVVSFPANLLAFALSNIRKGEIETCPEPKANHELSAAIRQYNATAEFLAQNTFLNQLNIRAPSSENQNSGTAVGGQATTLLIISMANYQYLASTLPSETLIELLNKYYFYIDKVSRLYNGTVCFCADGEAVIHFSSVEIEEDQSFFGACCAQLFLQIIGDVNDVGDNPISAKYRIAVHSGQALNSLYSPINQSSNNLSGETLDEARTICQHCPDNALLISAASFEQAGGLSRLDAEEEFKIGEATRISTFLAREPMAEYKPLIERQAIQLVTLFAD
ncbi:MAG: hypothetical protein CMQ16_01520 [Gammaproteobacteria bacterium]|nr:hypothetical protein [Gammaproteobacteria bacterium]